MTSSAAVIEVQTRVIDPQDFDRIVRENQKRIFRILLLFLRDADAADTLTQDCFLRAFEKRASFRGESAVETWLIRIALNLACDYSRNRRKAFWRRFVTKDEIRLESAVAPQQSPELQASLREQVARLWGAARQLPAQQKAAFLLRFGEDMSIGEIAEAMNLETGTVKSHLSRAVKAVRDGMVKSDTPFVSRLEDDTDQQG